MVYPHDSINKLLDLKIVNELKCVRYGDEIFFVSDTFFKRYEKGKKKELFPLKLASVRITDKVNELLFEYKLRPDIESKKLIKEYCVNKLMSDMYIVKDTEFNVDTLLSPLQNLLSFLRVKQ